jgi:glycosyltransferase involved in cell wall biosynthesis
MNSKSPQPMFTPRHIHLIDPGLKEVAGHNLTQDLSIARECIKRGIPVTIYARKGSNLGIQDVTVVENLHLDIFAEANPQRAEFAVFESFFLINRSFLADLNAIPADSFTHQDLVYFPNITQNQLEAVADWVMELPRDKRPTLAITLRYLNSKMLYNLNRGYGPTIELLYSHVLPKLLERHPRTYLYADTQVLSDNYTRLSGTQVTTLPIPHIEADATYARSVANCDALSLLYIGGWAQYHGSDFLPGVIESVLSDFPDVKFTVQVNASPDSADRQTMAALELAFAPRIKVLYGSLSTQEYASTLRAADIVVLLYLPSHYSFASSGVFTEAAALGKVLVVTAGTTLETSVRNFDLGAVVVPEFTIASCAAAVKTAILNFEELDQKVNNSYQQFSDTNSPKGFLDSMLSHIGLADANAV